MKKQDLDTIFSRYETEIFVSEDDVFNEKSLLSEIKSNLEWRDFSDKQRNEFHQVVRSVARKTKNLKQLEFEIFILEIYDLMIDVYDTIKNHEKDPIAFRLLSIINICKYYKNEFRDLSKMNLSPLKILLDFIRKNSSTDILLLEKSNLKLIDEKIDYLLRLPKAQMPRFM